jgi:hypothetical protein
LLSASDDDTPTGTDIDPLLGGIDDVTDDAESDDSLDFEGEGEAFAADDADDEFDEFEDLERRDDSDSLFIRADIADDEFGDEAKRP